MATPNKKIGGALPLAVLVIQGLGLAASAHASSTSQSTVDVSDVQPEAQNPASSDLPASSTPSYFRGSVGFEAAGYLYSPRTKTEDIYPTVVARPQAHLDGRWLEFNGQAEGIAMAPLSKQDETHAYLEVPEAYLGTSSRIESVKVSVGRKIEDWNRLDEQWRLGIWQPRYRWDYLRPDTVALTGLTIEIQRPLFKAVILGSPIFVPERGVPVSNDNGQLISDSPWFISPPNNIQVLTRDTPLKYDLRIPSMSKLLFHPGASGMIRIGDVKGPWLSGAYAYKPMNQLLLSYDGQLLINSNRSVQDVAAVPIMPRVVYHHVVSAEAGFHHDIVSGWVSTLMDRPGHDYGQGLTGTWTQQTVISSVAISPTVQFHIQDEKDNRMKAELSYLYQEGGNGPDLSADGKVLLAGRSVFESRYPFQSALKAGGELEMPTLLSSLGMHNAGMTAVASSLLYDTKNRGSIFSVDLKYLPTARWELAFGADVLGSQAITGSPESGPNDFIGRYQANDRLRAGVKYVF